MNKHKQELINQLVYVTAEECGELTQACMKVARFGLDTDSRAKLLEEAGDVYCMIMLMIDNGVITEQELIQRGDAKRDKLNNYTPIIVKGD